MENDVTSKTIGALSGIPFENIIGGPLSACIKAQAEAAVSTVNFIESVGLRSNGDKKEAIYVVFSYVQNGRRANISVPLLTIVPIPYIAINNISLNFKVAITGTETSEIVDETSLEANVAVETSSKKGGGWLTKRKTSKMTTSVSTKKDSKATQDSSFSIESTMDVKVQAGQESMPAGMAKILELLGSAMDVVPENGELTVDGPYEEGTNKYIIARYKNPEGLYDPSCITWDGGGAGTSWQDGTAKRFDISSGVTGTKTVTAKPKNTGGSSNSNTKTLTRTINIS